MGFWKERLIQLQKFHAGTSNIIRHCAFWIEVKHPLPFNLIRNLPKRALYHALNGWPRSERTLPWDKYWYISIYLHLYQWSSIRFRPSKRRKAFLDLSVLSCCKFKCWTYRVALNTNFTTSNLMYLLLPGKFKIYNMSV